MKLTFGPKGMLQIDDARITYKNFAGRADKFNREGDRNFTLIIPDQECCDLLVNDLSEQGAGWNVKIKAPREEGENPRMTLKVKVKFTDFGPNVYLKSGNNTIRLDEESIACLDNMYLERIDLDIRPYDDEINGKPFRAAYLHSMHVVQGVTDRFASRFESDN